MAIFSTNQNRHLFVLKSNSESKSTAAGLTNKGDIYVGSVGNGAEKAMYFLYQGADGVQKSDYIQIKNIDYVKPIKASNMAVKLKKVEVTLDDNPVAGQDYVLRIVLREFFGMSDENQYFKDAAVHATSGMTKSDFYKAMVNSLNLCFSREVGANSTSNPYLTFTAPLKGGSGTDKNDATKIVIEEKAQPWTLGIEKQERVYFDVQPTTIYTNGADVIWGTATVVEPTTTVGNGKQIADLEWFSMGERGDQYRMMGYPNYIPTEYFVDPTLEYNVIEIHYAFTDTGVNSYRSEKDLTIAVPKGAASHEYDVINALIDYIETATGLTIAGLSD